MALTEVDDDGKAESELSDIALNTQQNNQHDNQLRSVKIPNWRIETHQVNYRLFTFIL